MPVVRSNKIVLRQLGFDGLVHIEMPVERQKNYAATYWTPMCSPNVDWDIFQSRTVKGFSTCLWCVANLKHR